MLEVNGVFILVAQKIPARKNEDFPSKINHFSSDCLVQITSGLIRQLMCQVLPFHLYPSVKIYSDEAKRAMTRINAIQRISSRVFLFPDFRYPFRMINKWIAIMLKIVVDNLVSSSFKIIHWVFIMPFQQYG